MKKVLVLTCIMVFALALPALAAPAAPDKPLEFKGSQKTVMALAARMDVEATALGRFTTSGFFEVRYHDRIIASMPMEFMHDGVPQLELEAEWKAPEITDVTVDVAEVEQTAFLQRMVAPGDCSPSRKVVSKK